MLQINRRLMKIEEFRTPDGNTLPKWLPPPPRSIICNTDVAIGDQHSVGAPIFRNEDWGAKTANNQGLYNVFFQSDSAGAVATVVRKPHEINALHHNFQELVVKFHNNIKHLNVLELGFSQSACSCFVLGCSLRVWVSVLKVLGDGDEGRSRGLWFSVTVTTLGSRGSRSAV
uniref:Uncharacterized protein n=1 Tax=Cannabis sativa TaxID=3483 RepID=A0A803P5E0_CANSA